MRGEDIQQHDLFSYGSLEERVPADHPLRPIRAMVDEALQSLDGRFEEIYGEDGRRSIPPERLLRALLLQMFYTIRSERMLMEQLEYNLLFRWFVVVVALVRQLLHDQAAIRQRLRCKRFVQQHARLPAQRRHGIDSEWVAHHANRSRSYFHRAPKRRW
jgi:transposase